MKNRKFLRSALAMLIVVASLMGMLPMTFAADRADKEQTIPNLADSVSLNEVADYEESLLQSLYHEYGLTPEEGEDSEFGYLTSEEKATLALETKGATKDIQGPDYIFLDFKVGDASRDFNWQVKTDSTKEPVFSTMAQGALLGYFSGTDPRIYMPVETDPDYIGKRLNNYVLKDSDVVELRVAGISPTTEGKYFSETATESYKSTIYFRTDADATAWSGVSGFKLKNITGKQTLRWSVPASQNGMKLYGLRWDPVQPEDSTSIGTGTGLDDVTRISIDYIYVGPAETAPVAVSFRNEENTANLTNGFYYVGYGKSAPKFSTGKLNTETADSKTLWGWAVHQYINGAWMDMEQFVTEPATVKCKYDTRFVLTKLTVPVADLSSVQYLYTGESAADDKYLVSVGATSVADLGMGTHGTPLDVSIVMDHSGSMGKLIASKTFNSTTTSSLLTYLETLDKTAPVGYYRATCFAKNSPSMSGGFDDFIYTMPMRYYGGQWQMQVLQKCNCNGSSERPFGMYPWLTSGLQPCSHVKWVSMVTAYELFIANARSTGNYVLGNSYTINGVKETLYFRVGVSQLGAAQKAITTFLKSLYKSNSNLAPGKSHSVSVVGYGHSVLIPNYPYSNLDNGYKTQNNYTKASTVTTALNASNYETILKAIRDPYVYGASRVDGAFKLLAGQLSNIEEAAGKTKVTAPATNYLPAANSGRERVVILLSDGLASSNVAFDKNVANAAVTASASLKANTGTKVYSVGVMSGLDSTAYVGKLTNASTDVQAANDFLNAISSRYKTAKVYNTTANPTKGNYYLSNYGKAGDALINEISFLWDGSSGAIDVSSQNGPGSLWLHEELNKVWKPDADSPIRIYAAPYLGSGRYGQRVLIGEHTVTTFDETRSITGYGYKLHITPAEERYSVSLQWMDSKTAFLRETSLNTGSYAMEMGSTLDVSKGYMVYMDIPVALDYTKTFGGNGIPLTVDAGGCYWSANAADTGMGQKIVDYDETFIHTEIPLYMDPEGDYEISVEDYEAIVNGEKENSLQFVLARMVDMLWNPEATNAYGGSQTEYVSYDIRITAEDGTDLYVRSMDFDDTEWREYVDIQEGVVDLSKDQSFTFRFYAEYFTWDKPDSFGRAPMEDILISETLKYIVPEPTVEPSEPTEPSEPSEPTEPSEPSEPTEPSEPEEPAAPEVVQALKPGHSLNLESSISINYVVSEATLSQYDSYEIKCYVGDRLSQPKAEIRDGYVYFVLTDVNALEMNTMVRSEIYGYKDGKVYVSPLDEYSVVTYVTNMLKKDLPEAFRKVCVNLLRYGAASQIYKGHNTDNLADASLTEEQRNLLTDLATVEFGNNNSTLEDLPNATVRFAGKTLVLDSTVAIKIVVDASAFAGTEKDLELRVKFTNTDGEEEVLTSQATVYNAAKKQYMFVVDQLTAAELREVLECRVYAGDEAVSQTMLYSADTYGNGKSGALLDLCKALFAYCDVAKAYFAAK